MNAYGTGRMIGIGLLAVLLGAAQAAQAADWYVATNGSGASGADWGAAYANIQTALDAAASNDTIYLAGHTFGLTSQINWTNSYVTIRGGYAATNAAEKPGPRDTALWPTVIRRAGVASHRLLYVNRVTYGVLEGVTLTGGSAYTGGGAHIADSPGVWLSDCIITNNAVTAGSAGGGGGVYANSGSETHLTNCLVGWNTSGTGERCGGAGIHAFGTLTVTDSRILHNRNLENRSDFASGGGVYFRGASAVLKNVLVANNYHARGIGAGLDMNAATHLRNCTVAFNLGEGVRGAGSVSNSIVWGNFKDITGAPALGWSLIGDGDGNGTNGCITGNPLFEFGFYLATNSPCVDAGSDTAAALGMAGYTVRTDGVGDAGLVDMGFHHAEGFDLSRAEIYVALTGDDGNGGTNWAEAFRTVTKALAAARDGSRVHVGAGVYSAAAGETLPLRAEGLTGLRIVGSNRAETVFAGGDVQRVISISGAPGMELAEVTVTRGRFGLGGGVAVEYSAGVSLTGCVITNNTAPGNNSRGGGLYAIGSGLTMTDCLVAWNTVGSGERVAGGGIWCDGSGNRDGVTPTSSALVMRDCRIVGNRNLETRTTDYRLGGGLFFNGTSGWLKNCLVTGNYHPRTPGGAGLHVNAVTRLDTCTVAFNAGEGVRGSATIRDSILWGNWIDVSGTPDLGWSLIGDGNNNGTNGCVTGDPRFEFGFYLSAASPCVDAGSDTAANLGLSDVTTRTDGTADTGTVDMGYHHESGFDMAWANLYVAADGDDGNAGTNAAAAFRTLTRALSEARDGTRIHVAPGVYKMATGETFPLHVSDKVGVQVLGAGAADTVFDANGSAQPVVRLAYAHQAVLRGLALTRGENEGGGVRIENSQNILVDGCRMESNRFSFARSAPINGGGLSASLSSTLVSNCLVRGNYVRNTVNHSQGFARGGGIWSDGPLAVHETVIADNEVSALTTRGQGGGVYFAAPAPTTLRNVLVARNSADNAGDGIYAVGSSGDLAQVTVADNQGEGLRQAGGTVNLLNSILWNNGADLVGTMASISHANIGTGGYGTTPDANGNLSADPLFADAPAGNYRLLPGSPSVNAGLLQDWMAGATDIEGNKRVSMGSPDMGCYELPTPAGTMFMIR